MSHNSQPELTSFQHLQQQHSRRRSVERRPNQRFRDARLQESRMEVVDDSAFHFIGSDLGSKLNSIPTPPSGSLQTRRTALTNDDPLSHAQHYRNSHFFQPRPPNRTGLRDDKCVGKKRPNPNYQSLSDKIPKKIQPSITEASRQISEGLREGRQYSPSALQEEPRKANSDSRYQRRQTLEEPETVDLLSDQDEEKPVAKPKGKAENPAATKQKTSSTRVTHTTPGRPSYRSLWSDDEDPGYATQESCPTDEAVKNVTTSDDEVQVVTEKERDAQHRMRHDHKEQQRQTKPPPPQKSTGNHVRHEEKVQRMLQAAHEPVAAQHRASTRHEEDTNSSTEPLPNTADHALADEANTGQRLHTLFGVFDSALTTVKSAFRSLTSSPPESMFSKRNNPQSSPVSTRLSTRGKRLDHSILIQNNRKKHLKDEDSIENSTSDEEDWRNKYTCSRQARKRKKQKSWQESDDEEWAEVSEKHSSRKGSVNKSGRKKTPKHGADNPIEIEDSEEEEEIFIKNTRSRSQPVSIDLARLTVGKLFSHCDCKVELLINQIILQHKNKKKKDVDYIHSIELTDIEFFKYNIHDENDCVLVVLRATPTDDNNLKSLSSSYLQAIDTEDTSPTKAEIPRRGYIALELRSKEDLQILCNWAAENLPQFIENAAMSTEDCRNYAASLLAGIEKDDEERRKSLGSPRKQRRPRKGKASGLTDNPVLLVFPFGHDEERIDSAAEGLNEAFRVLQRLDDEGVVVDGDRKVENTAVAGLDPSGSESEPAEQTDIETDANEVVQAENQQEPMKGSARAHFLTIRQEDFDRLEPGEFLNDTLIDFWMQWMMRNENRQSSPIHIFSSHFYTTLKEDGAEAVASWTSKKNIDIFKKRFVFVPINKSLHWSLCVVVNPLRVIETSKLLRTRDTEDGEMAPKDKRLRFRDKDESMPAGCIIFLDSLKAHRKTEVAKHIRNWLNSEWKRLYMPENPNSEGPFNKNSMEVFDPKIPYQDNSWDCGVFVCRYAFALFMERHEEITVGDVFGLNPFERVITRHPEFHFGMDDIERMRSELKDLILRLSNQYKEWVEAMKVKKQNEKTKAMLAVKQEGAKNSAKTECHAGQDEEDETKKQAHSLPESTNDVEMTDAEKDGGDALVWTRTAILNDVEMKDADDVEQKKDSVVHYV